jgi:hypothetical protein
LSRGGNIFVLNLFPLKLNACENEKLGPGRCISVYYLMECQDLKKKMMRLLVLFFVHSELLVKR